MYANSIKIKPIQLVLGKKYMVTWKDSKTIRICKFIKVTPKGHNFLADDMDKCLFKKHIYASNSSNHLDGTWFWLPESVKISEYIPEVIKSEKSDIESYNEYKERKTKNDEFYSWTDYNKTVLRVIPSVPEKDRVRML